MFELKELELAAVEELQTRWFKQLDDIAEEVDVSWLYGDYEGRLARMRQHFQKVNESKLYLLNEKKEGNPRAVIQLTNAHRSKDPAVKFLEICVEPALSTEWRENFDKDFISDLFKVSAGAVYCAAVEARNVSISKLKIYGRTEELRNTFDSMVMDVSKSGLNVYREGKWLIIEMER